MRRIVVAHSQSIFGFARLLGFLGFLIGALRSFRCLGFWLLGRGPCSAPVKNPKSIKHPNWVGCGRQLPRGGFTVVFGF